MIYAKAKATEEQKERAKRQEREPYRDTGWDHRSGREDTWREYERERPQPGPSGLS